MSYLENTRMKRYGRSLSPNLLMNFTLIFIKTRNLSNSLSKNFDLKFQSAYFFSNLRLDINDNIRIVTSSISNRSKVTLTLNSYSTFNGTFDTDVRFIIDIIVETCELFLTFKLISSAPYIRHI